VARKIIDVVVKTEETFPTAGRDSLTKAINAVLMFSGKRIHRSANYRIRIEKLTEDEVEWREDK